MKNISKTTKLAIYTSAGLIIGTFIGNQLNLNSRVAMLAGGLIGTISAQPGEWKKLVS